MVRTAPRPNPAKTVNGATQPLQGKLVKANLMLFIAAFIWGTAFVAQRVGMEYVGPFTFNGIRFALGAMALIPFCMTSKNGWHCGGNFNGGMSRHPILLGGLMCGTVLYAGAALQQLGLIYTTAAKAAFITGLYVVLVPLAGFFMGKKLGFGGYTGALLAAFGLYLLSITDDFSIQPGDGLVLVGALFWAAHVLLMGWLAPKVNLVRLASAQFWICSALSLLTAFALEEITLPSVIDAGPSIIYGGLISVGIGYTLQVIAQKDAEPTHAALILSLEAVFAALAGWVMLDEALSLRAAIGCALMLAGMVLAQLKA